MHLTFRFITMMRGGLISMLYGKATEVALVDVDTASSMTLMSADIERIVTGMETGHEVRKHGYRLIILDHRPSHSCMRVLIRRCARYGQTHWRLHWLCISWNANWE